MPLANQLLLPQERFNITWRPHGTQRVVCSTCGSRTLRKHLKVCEICGHLGCPGCISQHEKHCWCRKEKAWTTVKASP